MQISKIIEQFEKIAPLQLQESYDNAGLIIGSAEKHVQKALICLDVTDAVLDEAIEQKCELIVSHHPVIFKGLKKITGDNYVERVVLKAIRNDIAIYSMHTNLDNVIGGVNGKIAAKLNLLDVSILKGKKGLLKKLVTFCPVAHAEKVREALFNAGAGCIGNYDCCSFNTTGKGSFRAGEGTNPFVGEKNILHYEEEERIEIIYPDFKENQVLKSLFLSHT